MFEDDQFTDVTLVCEYHQQIKVQKVILSCVSEFIKEIVLRNYHPKPVIYLRVRFKYTSQCKVEQEDFDIFLSMAKEMKVEGLTVSDIVKVKTIVNYEQEDEVEADTPPTQGGHIRVSLGHELEVEPDTKRKIWEIVSIVHNTIPTKFTIIRSGQC